MTAIQPDDLEAAVAAGVLPETQADALRAFVAKRHLAPVRSGMEDERFRFMRGFNDFFFAIGIVLLGAATIFFTGTDPLYCLAAAAFMWALSELLVRRMRLVLPGILLSVLFVFFTYQSIPTNQLIYGGQTPRVTRLDLWPMLLGINATALSVTIKALIAAGIAGLYYWRFRLPFTILLIAASLVLSVLAATWYLTNARSGALESSVFLACGLAVFAAAMAFDGSDRERVTRRADCAFWLHLLAAPLIVHSLVSFVAANITLLTDRTAWVLALIILCVAVVAILIDRRALLVAALIYAGSLIFYVMTGTNVGQMRNDPAQGVMFFSTLFILGASVIVLGIGWHRLRRLLLAHIFTPFARFLPPAQSLS
jgi:hypothetical protein